MTINQKTSRVESCSKSLKKKKNTKVQSVEMKKEKTLNRILKKVGKEAMENMKNTYGNLSCGNDKDKKLQADGIFLNLMDMEINNNDIKFFLCCGGSRVNRLRQAKESGFKMSKEKKIPKHAFIEDDIELIRSYVNALQTEEGYPCSHRRLKHYLLEEGITWKKLWGRYKSRMEDGRNKVVSYERWLQYVHYHFPGLRLSRTTGDLCDACTRIDIELLRTDLSDEDRNALFQQKEMHMEAAIIQRQAMSFFIKQYVKNNNSTQILPDHILPEYLPEVEGTTEEEDQHERKLVDQSDDEAKVTSAEIPTVIIQAEDFGGSLNLPFYGFNRPSCDYFNSNLLIHNFIIANINENRNFVWFYDERGQDKGSDTLCSLRMYYELTLWEKYRHNENRPSISLRILDNCVGQNKSNTIMKFFALLSLLFYRKVTLVFLIPGHSHMVADRVVAWMKGSFKKTNIFHPDQFVAKSNTVKSIESKIFNHLDSKRPFYIGWENVVNKFFKNLPSGFTKNYFFEFEEGILTMKHLHNSEEENTTIVDLLEHRKNLDLIRKAVVNDIFGKESI